jgi:predicted NAD/FAD-dependent oxidoreductase
MVVVAAPLSLAFDGLFVNQGPLRWAARDSAKPGRTPQAQGECWVLHATPAWSQAQLAASQNRVTHALLEAFAALNGGDLPRILFTQAHRWRYALIDQPLDSGCLWDERLGIGACGDWCHGARIEGAWLSGEAVAGRLLSGAARSA